MPIDLDVQIASNDSDIPCETELQLWASSVPSKDQTTACLRIVDELEARALNLKYRQIDKSTNVLSFPADIPKQVNINHLGDIVICAAVVSKEAQQQNKSSNHHWAHLLIHGLLHLLGYDHIEEKDAYKMEALEIEILNTLEISNPYK